MNAEFVFSLSPRSLCLVVPKEADFSLCLHLFTFISFKNTEISSIGVWDVVSAF